MSDFQYLIDRRKEVKLTQQELSEKTGVSLRTIQRIEKGEVIPRTFTVKQIEKALNLSTTTREPTFPEQEDALRTLKLSLWSSILLPFLYSIIVYFVWKNNRWDSNRSKAIKVLVNQNLIASFLVIPILVLISLWLLKSFDLPMQIRQFPTSFLAYLFFAFANLGLNLASLEKITSKGS